MKEKEWMEYCSELQNEYTIFNTEYEKRAKLGKMGVNGSRGKANIPVLFANGKSVAEAWENSLIALWAKGVFVRTEYDQKDSKSGEYIYPPSKDCTMCLVIEEPLSEPRIHKDFPGGLKDLEEYRQEMVLGIKDHWLRDITNPDDKRWEYTYHKRVFNYEIPGLEKTINQFKIMAENLARSPITRRAQAITWKVWEDLNISDPACLQSIWGRILREHPEPGFEFYSDEKTGKPILNLNWRFRSRDGYEAAFMNDDALIELGIVLAQEISKIRKEKVTLGRFVDFSDSYHIYGQAFGDFLKRFGKEGLIKRHFIPKGEYDPNSRTWRSDSKLVQEIFKEAREEIPKKIAMQDEKYEEGKDLTKDSSKIFKKGGA